MDDFQSTGLPPDIEPSPPELEEAAEFEFEPEAETVCIVAKTPYLFDGRASTTQTVVLADGVESGAMRTGELLVLVHQRTFTSSTARCDVRVYNAALDPDAPDATFVDPRVLAQSLEIKSDMNVPACSLTSLEAPLGPELRFVLEFRQGTTEGIQILEISVYLVKRRGL